MWNGHFSKLWVIFEDPSSKNCSIVVMHQGKLTLRIPTCIHIVSSLGGDCMFFVWHDRNIGGH